MKISTPHLDKLKAACVNGKCKKEDVAILKKARTLYDKWIADMEKITSSGRERVNQMVKLLNEYKDSLEVELIMKRGSAFLKRQKGQLKLDNSILEEFLVHLVHPKIINGLGTTSFVVGPKNAFMSLSFRPRSFETIDGKPDVIIKAKDQDFVLGSEMFYKFSPDSSFVAGKTSEGSFVLAVIAAECKVNLDKTMFQEAAGTAGRMKQGCPIAKYFVLIEFLDMLPEDSRLTEIDNVFLLRHARRLPFDKRGNVAEVEKQRKESPIDAEVIWRFVEEIQSFIDAAWYDPDEALRRGSFV